MAFLGFEQVKIYRVTPVLPQNSGSRSKDHQFNAPPPPPILQQAGDTEKPTDSELCGTKDWLNCRSSWKAGCLIGFHDVTPRKIHCFV